MTVTYALSTMSGCKKNEKTAQEKRLQQKRLANQSVKELKAKRTWLAQDFAKGTIEIDAEILKLASFVYEA